jgi:precorrin-6A/cobalt-precorrin-6A reductase
MAVLILGGTAEARELKERLGDAAILALKRTHRLGGAAGLKGYAAIIDATHPFATAISANATEAGVPLLRLERPPYQQLPGDRWTYADDLSGIPHDARVFLTTGHHQLDTLAGHPAFFLIRALTRPERLPERSELVLAKGPFSLENELSLIDEHRLDLLVTKDSGGPDAKLRAANVRNLPVILLRRLHKPPARTVATVDEAVAWLQSTRAAT